jgi:ADP-heptose:LPS heptosyltransferase
MPLAALAPLFEVPGVGWQSLQLGAAYEIAANPAARGMAPLTADTPLDDTAAIISELDLVITVDTSIAHLAGALARPLWVMLPFAPGWRWLLPGDKSLWYPTARLFRQKDPRDWSTVVAAVRAELVARVASGASL